jgi:hypothetical protein
MPRHDIHLKRDLIFSFSFHHMSKCIRSWWSITWEEIKCIRIDEIKIKLFLQKRVCSMCLKLSKFIFPVFIIAVVEFCEEYIHGILIIEFLVPFRYLFRIRSKYTSQKIRLFKSSLKVHTFLTASFAC